MQQRLKAVFKQKNWIPYVFVAPFFIVFVTFDLYPMLRGLMMSFQEIVGFSNSWINVGIGNYLEAITNDPDVRIAIRNAIIYSSLSIITQIPIAFFLAVILTSDILKKTRDFYRILFYIPVVIPGVTMAMIALWFFNESRGFANELWLGLGGDTRIQWMLLPRYVMAMMLTINFWKSVGFHTIFIMAGLTGIDRTVVEASVVDGANAWERMLYIFVPLLKPIFAYLTVVAAAGSLMVFDIPFTLFEGEGGPGGQGWFPMTYIIDQAFSQHRLGFASALGWLLFFVASILTIAQLRLYDVRGGFDGDTQ